MSAGIMAAMGAAMLLALAIDRIDIDVSAESYLWCAGSIECVPVAIAGLGPPLLAIAAARLGWWDGRHPALPVSAVFAGIPLMLLVAEVTRP